MSLAVDINCDLGEGAGNDALLMPWVSSANIACGAHAGDLATMRATVRLAKQQGVAIGAHPGFEDKEHFGRRELMLSPAEIVALVRAQLEALCAVARDEGAVVTHVKPHGALYNIAARDSVVADAIAEAIVGVDERLWLYGLAGGALTKAGQARGLKVAAEVFADRTYQDDGSLTSRSRPDALVAGGRGAFGERARCAYRSRYDLRAWGRGARGRVYARTARCVGRGRCRRQADGRLTEGLRRTRNTPATIRKIE